MKDWYTNRIDALVFDLGGVVIRIDFDKVFAHWARSSNQDISDIKSRFSFDSFYEMHERGEIGASEYFDSLRSSLNLNINDTQFMEGWNSIYVGEVDGISELIGEIKGKIPIYAFTNSNKAHHNVWSKRFGHVLSHFNNVFISSEIGSRKPEPEAFKVISNQIGVKPEHILFFDDSRENITGARSIGIQAVHVTSLYDIKNVLNNKFI